MGNVTELRIALTVDDFDQAVAFYRDALGLEQIADWSSATGKVVVLEAGRATLELFDNAQAESVDAIEAGRRVSGTVRFALQVQDSVEVAGRLVAAGAERVAEPVTARLAGASVAILGGIAMVLAAKSRRAHAALNPGRASSSPRRTGR